MTQTAVDIEQVAQVRGVSPATVSRVLRDVLGIGVVVDQRSHRNTDNVVDTVYLSESA